MVLTAAPPKHRVDIAVTDFNIVAMFIILTLILI